MGSTGSVGTQALAVIAQYPHLFEIIALSAHTNTTVLEQQIQSFHPQAVACTSSPFSFGEIPCYTGAQALQDLLEHPCDIVINALVGTAGVKPSLQAAQKGITLALAHKETLVLAGDLLCQTLQKSGSLLLPIDSEHSALFQSLQGRPRQDIHRLILTMGKGKIATMTQEELRNVTLTHILSRPAWNMGAKITIDSATCMNKAFEIIEAKWLFSVDPSQIAVIVHPDYLCHSLVEFTDGSILTELGTADMRRYAQYALFYPERAPQAPSRVDLIGKTLRFEPPPYDRFPCLAMGHQVLEKGGLAPAVLHGANRAATELFIEGKKGFLDIPSLVQQALDHTPSSTNPSLEEILETEETSYQKVRYE